MRLQSQVKEEGEEGAETLRLKDEDGGSQHRGRCRTGQ